MRLPSPPPPEREPLDFSDMGYQGLRYMEFRRKHPEFLYALAGLAFQVRRRGFVRYGLPALSEVVRWRTDLTTGPDGTGLKLNNNYRSYLARDLQHMWPSLDGFFEIRRQGPWRNRIDHIYGPEPA